MVLCQPKILKNLFLSYQPTDPYFNNDLPVEQQIYLICYHLIKINILNSCNTIKAYWMFIGQQLEELFQIDFRWCGLINLWKKIKFGIIMGEPASRWIPWTDIDIFIWSWLSMSTFYLQQHEKYEQSDWLREKRYMSYFIFYT